MWTGDVVGDRFVRTGSDQWIDLATGCAADVRVYRGQSRSPGRFGVSVTALANRVVGDNGPIGTDGWFEARVRCDERNEDVDAWRRTASLLAAVSAAASAREAIGVRCLRIDAASLAAPRRFMARLAAKLRTLGYVTIRGSTHLLPRLTSQLAHRHLALVVADTADRDGARRWIRRAARASPRAHLVIDMRRADDRERDERAGHHGDAVRAREPSVRFNRAMLASRRGRHAEAERWLRSALESARRHGDEVVLVRAAARLTGCLLDRGAWRDARTLATACLDGARAWPSRVSLAPAAVDALLASGDIDRADAVIASISAESDVSDDGDGAILRASVMGARFWQGRFEEALVLARAAFDDPRDMAMAGLVGWAVGDRAVVSRARERLSTCPGERRVAIARAGLAALDACLLADRDDAARRGREVARLASRGSPSCAARLGLLVAAEAFRCSGRNLEAYRCLDIVARSSTPLDEAVALRLRTGWTRTRPRPPGIERWGLGRTGMHMLHVVPALLQVLQDAEDEGTALRQACEWLRQSAVADAVAIVDAGTLRVVASEGWARPDLESPELSAAVRGGVARSVVAGPDAIAVAPVRFAGTVIGAAIVRARAERGGTAEQAALTLASVAAPALRSRLEALAMAGDSRSRTPEILGRSPAIAALRESLARAAPTPFAVLIEGESGTGKELVARAIHRLSARRDRRFCAVNCAALTDELVESELFGSARGAFTGAVAPRAGLFEEAHGGTLFLDEVGELSPRAQAKLLRALQEREVRRLGENTPRAVDVRVVAATNLPLAEAVARGRFREDLLFRLAVVRIQLPPLRDRIEDVPMLALACWRRLSAEAATQALLGPDAVAALCRHRWRGNVRELQNVMAALVVSAPRRGRVTARLVQHVLASSSSDPEEPPVALDRARSTCERSTITAALARHAGRRALAARELGLTRQGLTKAIKRLGLDSDEETAGVA